MRGDGFLPRLGLRADDLWDMYWDLGWGLLTIARRLGVAPNTVRSIMLKNGIHTRRELIRWHHIEPWEAPEAELDPTDPAGYWLCAKSSRAGFACLLCQEEVPADCVLNCRECPPQVIALCPCAGNSRRDSQ